MDSKNSTESEGKKVKRKLILNPLPNRNDFGKLAANNCDAIYR